MKKNVFTILMCTALLTGLISCAESLDTEKGVEETAIENEETVIENEEAVKEDEETALETDSEQNVLIGLHCFEYINETLEEVITLKSEDGINFTGFIEGSVEDEANGYYTSYSQDITASLDGTVFKVVGIMEIEGFTEEFEDEWSLQSDITEGGEELFYIVKRSGDEYYPTTCAG
jgi:hypothetical protein